MLHLDTPTNRRQTKDFQIAGISPAFISAIAAHAGTDVRVIDFRYTFRKAYEAGKLDGLRTVGEYARAYLTFKLNYLVELQRLADSDNA
jgi:uncharacterized protein YmfQ (DUF2313 family)